MRKISYILISGCITLSIIGCDETFDTSNTSEGILSLSENGLTILQSYNVGEKYNADLWIQHGGLELNNSTVTFTVDKACSTHSILPTEPVTRYFRKIVIK